jgi:hypothetical protein
MSVEDQTTEEKMLVALKSADAFLNALSGKWTFCPNTRKMHDQVKLVIAEAKGKRH